MGRKRKRTQHYGVRLTEDQYEALCAIAWTLGYTVRTGDKVIGSISYLNQAIAENRVMCQKKESRKSGTNAPDIL